MLSCMLVGAYKITTAANVAHAAGVGFLSSYLNGI